MVTKDNHNQAMLLINKLLGPNAAASVPPPAHIPPPGHMIPGGPTGNFVPFPNTGFPPYFPHPPSQPVPPPQVLPKQTKTPEKLEQPGRMNKYNKRKSNKRRYDNARHGGGGDKGFSFDALIASHGTSSANRKPRESFTDHTQKVMGKQIREIISHPKKKQDVIMIDVDEKKVKSLKKNKRRVEKNYNDLHDMLNDDPVARKRRKIQEKVRIKRDSAIEAESKPQSIYDFMHFDPDKEALKKKKEKILSGASAAEIKKVDDVETTLKEIEKETIKDKEPVKPVEVESGEIISPTSATIINPVSTAPKRTIGIRGSLSRPPSPKPTESDIKKVLDEMEEGELSDDEQQEKEYNKLINDVETASKTQESQPAKQAPSTPVKMNVEAISPSHTPVKQSEPIQSSTDVMKKVNLNTVKSSDAASKPKSIPFLSTAVATGAEKKEVSILDDLAFLNTIKNKYHADDQPLKQNEMETENVDEKSRELIEQLLRQDKLNKEREKQRRNKEKQREKDKKERERLRAEKRREKMERLGKLDKNMTEILSQLIDPAKAKIKSAATQKLKKEFKSNFIKAAAGFEGTLTKSTIDNSILTLEKQNEVDEYVETNEHRFENGLVIQTSTKKIDEAELYQKNKPIRYDFSKVNVEYPIHAVAGAIAYRLKEKKQKLIHRVVNRIGKEKALELLFKTEEIERSGGEKTNQGDRRKEPGGVFLGLLKKELPQDDVKYIFTVENELESASNIARKKLQRLAKKKRYNKNKQENKLVNALESALNLGLGDDNSNNGEEDPVLDFIPEPSSIPLPFIPKPKKFELSFVKPATTKEFVVIGEEKSKPPDTTNKMAAMMKGYTAFVKKGTSTSANIFKPSVASRMSEEPNLFDNLLREASNKQKTVASQPEPPITEDVPSIIGPVIPAVQPPPPAEEPPEAAPEAAPVQTAPMTSWDYQTLVPLPDSRTSAIINRNQDYENLSEGELSDSDDEKMET